jgi:hypothetical protein
MRDGRQIGFGPRDQVLREVLNYDVSEQNGQNVPSAYNA